MILLPMLFIVIFGVVALSGFVSQDENEKKAVIKISIGFIGILVVFLGMSSETHNKPWRTVYDGGSDIMVTLHVNETDHDIETGKVVTKKQIDKLMSRPQNLTTLADDLIGVGDDEKKSEITILLKNEAGEAERTATLERKNIIERTPKGAKTNYNAGLIVKVEYAPEHTTNKWFGIEVGEIKNGQVRVTVEYDPKTQPSPEKLFNN